jgi:hypothetical protein
MSATFWTIVREGYDVNPSSIIKARWLSEEEKKTLTEEFKAVMVCGIEHHEIKNLTYEDTEDLWKSGRHVCFSGGHNDAVIIPEDLVTTLLRLDAERGRKKKIESLKEWAENCKKEIESISSKKLHTKEEAKSLAAKYRETMNEGGGGYVPHFYTYEELDRCKDDLARAEKKLRELEK